MRAVAAERMMLLAKAVRATERSVEWFAMVKVSRKEAATANRPGSGRAVWPELLCTSRGAAAVKRDYVIRRRRSVEVKSSFGRWRSFPDKCQSAGPFKTKLRSRD
jgi:hypothetical protein